MIYPSAKLGTFLRHRAHFDLIDDTENYKRLRVQLHGKGIVLRDETPGVSLKTKKQQIARASDFLVAEIDAKVGGFGIVPALLDGAIVSSHYFLFEIDESVCLSGWLDAFIRSGRLEEQVAARGSTNYAAVRPNQVLDFKIPLPPITDQRRIVAWIESIAERLSEVQAVRRQATEGFRQLLGSAFARIVATSRRMRMAEVAPLARRPVEVQADAEYPELGIRSFGKGTFHKPSVPGFSLGTKRLYRIEPGDLLFNNVFAWEGAVAVAREADAGRFGSHRFMTCVPKKGLASAEFLKFYFLTAEGLESLGAASPGGAGRNRTLGVEALAGIVVPVPEADRVAWFDRLLSMRDQTEVLGRKVEPRLDALLPAVISQAVSGGRL